MEDSEISSYTMALILEGGLVGECNCKTCLNRTKMYLSFLTHIHGQSVLGKKIISGNSQMALVASTIRSSFAATPGHRLVVGDLAQIESRVLAVLAQCQKMKDAYAAGRDLYKECMSAQLGKPIDQIDSTERARGKIIILGCGFQMGWEKFQAYALTYGIKLSEEEAKDAVYGFRETYHEIPALWAALNSAVIRAVKAGMCVFVNGLVVDGRDPRVMKIKLPSGRCLHYFEPKVIIDQKFGRPQEVCRLYSVRFKGFTTVVPYTAGC